MKKDGEILGVADSADFQPAYDGEEYVTLTFRVPKATRVVPGVWTLTPLCPGTYDWAQSKRERAEA